MNNKEAKIVAAQGNGVHGRIVVTSNNSSKTIPAVLFSSTEAQTLLQIVDKVENKRKY